MQVSVRYSKPGSKVRTNVGLTLKELLVVVTINEQKVDARLDKYHLDSSGNMRHKFILSMRMA